MTITNISRGHPDYFGLVDAVTSTVTATVPPSKTVLVVSKGDEDLLRLGSRSGWHFPRLDDGRYAGYYPTDAADAIEQLEELRRRGADYIVFPATSMWWLDIYPELGEHLEANYGSVLSDGTCTIYDLSGDHPSGRDDTRDEPAPAIAPSASAKDASGADARQLAAFLDVLLPDEAIVGIVRSDDEGLTALAGRQLWHLPRNPPGANAQHRAADADLALDQLDGLRDQGMNFLVVPRAAQWLSGHPGFIERVEHRYRCVARRRFLCSVYELSGPRQTDVAPSSRENGSPLRRWFRAPKRRRG